MSPIEQPPSPASSGGDTLRLTPEHQSESSQLDTGYHRQKVTPYEPNDKGCAPDVDVLFAELAQLKEERHADAVREHHLRGQLALVLNTARDRECDLTAQVASLQSQLCSATDRQQELNVHCTALCTRVNELIHDLSAAQERAETAEGRVQTLEPLLDQSRRQLQEKCIQADTLGHEMTRHVLKREEEMQQEMDAMRREVQKVPVLEESLGRWKARAELAEARMQQLSAEAASSRLQAQRIADVEMAFKQRDAQANAAEARARMLVDENTSLRQSISAGLLRIADLTSRAETVEKRAGELEAENEALRHRTQTIETASGQHHNAVLQQASQMRNELEALRTKAQRVSDLEDTIASLQTQAERSAGLESALANLHAQAKLVEDHARQVEDECASLRQTSARLPQLEADAEALRRQAQSAETALTEATKRLGIVEGSLSRCGERAAKLGEEVLSLRAALTGLRKKPVDSGDERWQSERESLLAGMRELLPAESGFKLSDASEVLRAVESEFERLRDRTDAVERQLASLEDRYEARGRSYTTLRTRLAEVERNAWRF